MNDFMDYLIDVKHATPQESKNELWNVQGILKNRSNEVYKFDTRPIIKQPNGEIGKKGTTKTKAQKMVFKTKLNYIVVDIEELHSYIQKNKIKKVHVEDLLKDLEWNIII